MFNLEEHLKSPGYKLGRKKYSKRYYQEHKEEIRKRNKEWYKQNRRGACERMKARYQEVRRKAFALYGSCCVLCKEKKNLQFHEKSGKPHVSKVVYEVIRNPERFTLVCYRCHVGVHFCLERLKLSFEEVRKRCEG